MNKKTLMILLSLVGLLSFSCTENSADKSLSTEEYIELGIPKIDSAWGKNEYNRCVKALERIKQEEFESLPQLQSKKSNEVFKRIVSLDNINKLFEERRTGKANLNGFLDSYQEIIHLYMGESEIRSEPYYHKELVELFILLTELSNHGFSDVKNMPAAILSTSGAKVGFDQMVDGYKKQMIGLLEMQTEILKFTESDLMRLSHSTSESLFHQMEFLDTNTRKQLADAIMKLLEKENSMTLKESYSRVLEKLSH